MHFTCVLIDARLTVSRRVYQVYKTGQIAKPFRPMWKWEALATVMDGKQNPVGTLTKITMQDGVKNNYFFYSSAAKPLCILEKMC